MARLRTEDLQKKNRLGPDAITGSETYRQAGSQRSFALHHRDQGKARSSSV
jgi:hypothetical protein